MENGITRFVALLIAMGSTGLFWTLGVFVTVPWQQGRMLALDRNELQVIVVPLLMGIAVGWGALHLFAMADREANPRCYKTIRALLVIASLAAVIGGSLWSQARMA